MLNDIKRTLSSFNCVSSRKLPLLSGYLLGLMVIMKKHNFEAMSRVAQCHPSRLSVFLNSSDAVEISQMVFNRATRRKLSRLKAQKGKTFIAIDATFSRRSSKRVENSKVYHSGSGYVRGHKWLNIVLIHDQQIIPLCSQPLYSKEYCEDKELEYKTEPDFVVEWLQQLRNGSLFTQEQLKSIIFLADSGYDSKKIQKAIRQTGSHFVIALKSSRTVKDFQVAEYFKRHKKGHRNTSIRFIGSGKKRISYQVRLATGIQLKGFGKVNVVCSQGRRGPKWTVKYLATSDCRMAARDLVKYYRQRWSIETWHKEVKQHFGFGDCSCHQFSAVHAHVQLVMAAYILRSLLKIPKMTIDQYQSQRVLKSVRAQLTKIGNIAQTQSLINEALHDIAC